jgi:hypothetical protein
MERAMTPTATDGQTPVAVSSSGFRARGLEIACFSGALNAAQIKDAFVGQAILLGAARACVCRLIRRRDRSNEPSFPPGKAEAFAGVNVGVEN